MKIFKFLFSKIFLINIVVAIALLLGLYFIVMKSLDSYTNHGDKVVVPDFTGMTIKDAQELAKQHNLRAVISDTTYSEETKRGLIAAQIPSMESEIKKDRTIYLTINSMSAEMVSMPNFKGVSLRQAIADAEIYGLIIGELTYVPDIAKNNVLEQKMKGKVIEGGTRVEKGSFIDLTLGMGLSNEKVFIPFLLNQTLQNADSMLRAKYLNTGAKFYDQDIETAEDSALAIIYQQQPEPFGKNFKPGDFVDLWFTKDSSKVIITQAWKDSLGIKTDTITLN